MPSGRCFAEPCCCWCVMCHLWYATNTFDTGGPGRHVACRDIHRCQPGACSMNLHSPRHPAHSFRAWDGAAHQPNNHSSTHALPCQSIQPRNACSSCETAWSRCLTTPFPTTCNTPTPRLLHTRILCSPPCHITLFLPLSFQDEVRPRSCRGKDSHGGAAMTLVDTLDALALLNKPDALTAALQALRNLTWDIDQRVHVFELTIR